MKLVTSITKSLCIVLYLVSLVLGSINCAYASKEELLDLEEEKSDIEDRIEERRARGKSYDDLEEHRSDVQDVNFTPRATPARRFSYTLSRV